MEIQARCTITAGTSRYEALVGRGLLDGIGDELAKLLPASRCAVVADEKTAPLFGEVVVRSLRQSRFEPTVITVPPGEGAKSLEQLGRICDEMAAAKLDRTSF